MTNKTFTDNEKKSLLEKIKNKPQGKIRTEQLLMFYRNWGNKFGDITELLTVKELLPFINI